MATTVMEHSRFFCYMAKQIKSHKGITNIRTVEKVMPQQISSNGFAGGCFLAYAAFCGIGPLTCTHFDPTIFLNFQKKWLFHIGPTSRYTWLIVHLPIPAGKGQHGWSRCVTGARGLRRASGRKQLTDKFVCLPENDGRILPA